MSFRSKEKWGGSRLQLRHPLRPFLGVCPPCSNQQNPPGALIFPCVCVSGCRALGFGGAVPHYPRTMEESPREGGGGEPFCTLPPAQPSTLSILGKLRHGGVKMRAGRAGVRLILLVPPKTPLWSHGKAGGRRGGGADNTALSKPPPESLGAGAGGAGARGCRHGAGARGLRGGPCQHPASSQPSPSPSAEGRGLLSASQLPAGILGCNELLRSQASTWQRWVVFALEQRTPKEEEGGGRQLGDTPSQQRPQRHRGPALPRVGWVSAA